MLELFTKKTKKVIGIAALTCFLATPISYTMSVSSAAAAALDNQIQFDQRHEPRPFLKIIRNTPPHPQKTTVGKKIKKIHPHLLQETTVGTEIKKIHHHLLHVMTAMMTVGIEMTKTTIKAISLQLYWLVV